MNDARALLDSLFGTDRDAVGSNVKRQSFKDEDVCKYYLVGDCPHEHFVNTEGKPSKISPIGGCKRQHSEAMRRALLADKESKRYRRRYLEDLQAELKRLVDENDKKLKANKQKLKDGRNCTTDTAEAVEGHVSARETLVTEKVAAAEKMAEEGNMEASKKTMEEAEELAHEKYRLNRLKEVAEGWLDEVCEVCGMQISWRAIEEIEARSKGRPHPHVPGAWHQGWARTREALELVNKQVEEAQADPESKGKDRDGDKGRDRERKQRSSRSRDRDRRRSASKARKEKEKEKEKDKEKREKEKEKEKKEKERKRSRSRSKERKRSRTKSKERRRSRSRSRDGGRKKR